MNPENLDNKISDEALRIPIINNPHTFENIPEIEKNTPVNPQNKPFLAPSSLGDILKFDMSQKFVINRKNLNNFIIQANHVKDMPINMKIFRSYFKVPFEIFPESKEIPDIFSKIIQRIMLTKTQIRNWYYEDVILLVWIVVRYCFMKLIDFRKLEEKDWEIISSMIPSKTPDLCKFKWLSLNRLNVQETPWTEEEDEALKQILNGRENVKWSDIAKELFKKNNEIVFRTGKLCRERWNNYLDPNLKKGGWSLEEDLNLLKAVKETGKKWSEISKKIVGRTENAVKNRYNSIMKKEKKLMKTSDNLNDTSFGSNSSFPNEEVEKELLKNLIIQKQQTHNNNCGKDKMEMEIINKYDSESIASNRKKDQKIKGKNVFHLKDLGIDKKENILFELLKFDYFEEEEQKNPLNNYYNNPTNSQNTNTGGLFSLNPVINTSQSITFQQNRGDTPKEQNFQNIMQNSNCNINNLNMNNPQQSGFGPRENPHINLMHSANFMNNNNNININNINSNNQFGLMNNQIPYNPWMQNSLNLCNPFANQMNPFANNNMTNSLNYPFDSFNYPMAGSMAGSMMNNAMIESTQEQLKNYYMRKNMELFEKFLLTQNSEINNYHNFQNLQKIQKATQNLNQNLPYELLNQQMFNSGAMGNFQNFPQINLNKIDQNDEMKPEIPQNNEQQMQPEQNINNIRFPNFIVPNNITNPLLDRIKSEQNNVSSSNTSNSIESFKSLVSSINTFGSLTSISNISEPSPNPFSLLFSQNQKNQNILQNDNNPENQAEENQMADPIQLSNYNIKNISEFNMLEQSQSNLQFAIINPEKHEIYICGNFKQLKQNEPAPPKRKSVSPKLKSKKNRHFTGITPCSPKSKFHELSPSGRKMNQEAAFDNF